MEGKDFIIWFFAALMVLAPLATGAARHAYDGNTPISAPVAAAPATAQPATTPPTTTK